MRMMAAVATVLPLVLDQMAPPLPDMIPTPHAQEEVVVDRVIISGRVIDRFGNPIRGLTVDDFILRVDGLVVPIEAVDSRDSSNASPETLELRSGIAGRRGDPAAPADRTSESRTIVMLFQWEISGQKDSGFLRMMQQAKKIVDAAADSDRIAILGFGSSLRLLQDLTNDRAALKHAISSVRNTSFRGLPAAGDTRLDGAVAQCPSSSSIQKAVQCIGWSLQSLPGPKTLLFFGWTLGRPRQAGWHREYPAMVEALGKSRTSVFVLDVSDGHHSLAPGLRQIAADTGGLYNGGCLYEMVYCADLARMKTQRAFSTGGYDVVFRDLGARRGWHEVEIELKHPGGIPTFQRWYRT